MGAGQELGVLNPQRNTPPMAHGQETDEDEILCGQGSTVGESSGRIGQW